MCIKKMYLKKKKQIKLTTVLKSLIVTGFCKIAVVAGVCKTVGNSEGMQNSWQ